jgi:hypothetical protein
VFPKFGQKVRSSIIKKKRSQRSQQTTKEETNKHQQKYFYTTIEHGRARFQTARSARNSTARVLSLRNRAKKECNPEIGAQIEVLQMQSLTPQLLAASSFKHEP